MLLLIVRVNKWLLEDSVRARVTATRVIGFSPITDVFQISVSDSDVLINSPEPSSLSHVGHHVTSDHHLRSAKRGERRKWSCLNAYHIKVQVHVLVKITEILVMISELCAWTSSLWCKDSGRWFLREPGLVWKIGTVGTSTASFPRWEERWIRFWASLSLRGRIESWACSSSSSDGPLGSCSLDAAAPATVGGMASCFSNLQHTSTLGLRKHLCHED